MTTSIDRRLDLVERRLDVQVVDIVDLAGRLAGLFDAGRLEDQGGVFVAVDGDPAMTRIAELLQVARSRRAQR